MVELDLQRLCSKNREISASRPRGNGIGPPNSSCLSRLLPCNDNRDPWRSKTCVFNTMVLGLTKTAVEVGTGNTYWVETKCITAVAPDALVLRSCLLLLLEARHSPPHGTPGLFPFPELGEQTARSVPNETRDHPRRPSSSARVPPTFILPLSRVLTSCPT